MAQQGRVESHTEHAPAALHEAELRYRTVVDTTYDWEYWQAPDGSLRYISPSCERITGYPAAEFLSNPQLLDEIVHPDDSEIWAEHRQKETHHQGHEIQLRILRPDGEIRWIEHLCQPVTDENGAFLGRRVSNRDATARQQAQEELRRYREHLEELVAERTTELEAANLALRAEITERQRAEEAQKAALAEALQATHALQRGEERYALAQRAASIGSWDWNILTGDLHWSDQIEPLFGFERDEFGATYEAFLECVHPDDRQRVIDAVDASVAHDADYEIEHRIVWPDGTVRWVQETGDVMRDSNGEPVRMLGIVQDVTDRKRIERALQQATEEARAARAEEEERRVEAERRHSIAESLGDVLKYLNSNRPLVEVLDYIAAQAGELLGTDAAGIYKLERDAGIGTAPNTRRPLVTHVAGIRLRAGQDTLHRAITTRRPVGVSNLPASLEGAEEPSPSAGRQATVEPGTQIYRALLAVPILVQDQVYGGMLLYYGETRDFCQEEMDLAVALGDQVALAIGNDQLRRQVEEAATSAERDRLARDLHDAVTQTLFSASLIAEAMPHIWEQNPQEGRRGLEELRRLTRAAAAEMRTMLVELRPAALTEKPLGELLRHLTEAMAGRTRLPVELKVDGDSLLDPDIQIALYRITQEALNNIAKHSAASAVTVDLACRPDRTALHISDNGVGFAPGDILPDRFGLGIMRERAQGIGATIQIDSQPGTGTKISVTCTN